jgi:putative oligomerization/nucleic acid binding protein
MGLFKNKRKQAQDLFDTGSKGVGTVLQVQDTGMTVNDNPRVKMVLRVEPIDGAPAFDAQKTTTVSRVEIPRQGDRYPIWYDAQDPANTWAYATVADDDGRATMRQLFGAAADGFVGMGGAPAAPAAAAPQADPVEQLEKLAALHAQGALTDEEFAAQKARLLG